MKQKAKSILATAGMLTMMVLWLLIAVIVCEKAKSFSLQFNQIPYYREFITRMEKNAVGIRIYILLASMPMLAYWLIVLLPQMLKSCLPRYRSWNWGYTAIVTVILVLDLLVMSCTLDFLSVFGVSKVLQAKLISYQIQLVPVMFFLSLATWLVTQVAGLLRRKKRLTVAGVGQEAIGYVHLLLMSLVASVGTTMMLNVLRVFDPSAVGKVIYGSQTNARYMARVFTTVICAPIMEEIAFRGVISHVLDKRVPRWWGLVIGAVLFGLWHRNLGQFVYTFVMGLYYGYLYVTTGKLRYSIFCHFANNLLVVLAYSRSELDYFGPQPLLNGIVDFLTDIPAQVSAVLMVACIGSAGWLLRRFAQRHGQGRKA